VALQSFASVIEQGVSIMIWETPVAIDLRLGMEITMYAEHR
jgi:coenzyme PQQ precursor peptide PqqA